MLLRGLKEQSTDKRASASLNKEAKKYILEKEEFYVAYFQSCNPLRGVSIW